VLGAKLDAANVS